MSSIDVIVPCYRYARYLRPCVESVLGQDGVEVRVHILDDASPDETPEVGARLAAEDPRVTYWRNPVNLGHIATYNKGIEWAEAPCLLLLSADDYLLPGALGAVMRMMDDDARMSLCFGNARVLGTNGSQRETTVDIPCGADGTRKLSGPQFIDACIAADASNIVPTPTAVVRTSLIKASGGYRADLPHSADMAMWLHLAAHGSVGFIGKSLAVYRRHATNMSLGYTGDHCLSDLQQRAAACDEFLRACGSVLPDAHELHRRLLRGLARETLGHASAAFNGDSLEQSAKLAKLALRMHPGARLSRPWLALAVKKLLGARLSRSLLSVGARWRAADAGSPPSAA